jgi:hypothetical protein
MKSSGTFYPSLSQVENTCEYRLLSQLVSLSRPLFISTLSLVWTQRFIIVFTNNDIKPYSEPDLFNPVFSTLFI